MNDIQNSKYISFVIIISHLYKILIFYNNLGKQCFNNIKIIWVQLKLIKL